MTTFRVTHRSTDCFALVLATPRGLRRSTRRRRRTAHSPPLHGGASPRIRRAGGGARRGGGASTTGILPTIAKLVNFAVLVGVLVYFLRAPIAAISRRAATQIRQDLVTAAEMRAAATAQLAEIERKLEALPGGARGAASSRARRTSRPSRRASPRRPRPNASGCSSRRAARSTCGCASRGAS